MDTTATEITPDEEGSVVRGTPDDNGLGQLEYWDIDEFEIWMEQQHERTSVLRITMRSRFTTKAQMEVIMAYADEKMTYERKKHTIYFFGGQDALMNAARQLGYGQKSEHWEMQYDFAYALDYPLPEGFQFIKPQDLDISKVGNTVTLMPGIGMALAPAVTKAR